MPEPTDDSPEVRTFAAFLVEHNGSVSHDELTKSLTELVERVEETGRTGTLTYILKLAPAGRMEGALKISDDIKVKLPALDRADAIYFVTADHGLSRDNPAQPRLPLRDVSRKAEAAPSSERSSEGGA